MQRITRSTDLAPALAMFIAAMTLAACAESEPPQRAAAATKVAATPTSAAASLPACCPTEAPAAHAAAHTADAHTDADAAACEFCEPADAAAAKTADAQSAGTTPLADALKPAGADNPSVAGEWVAPADRPTFYLNFDVETQTGETLNMTSLRGKPMAMTFIFTLCPNPQMCPLIASTMAELQDLLADRNLSDRVQLALVTYDPVYDTPERLLAYGEKFGLTFDNAVMLRAQGATFREMLSEFSIAVGPGTGGLVNHRNELLLIDREGRYVRDYRGSVWPAAAVADDLARLVDEAPMTTAQ